MFRQKALKVSTKNRKMETRKGKQSTNNSLIHKYSTNKNILKLNPCTNMYKIQRAVKYCIYIYALVQFSHHKLGFALLVKPLHTNTFGECTAWGKKTHKHNSHVLLTNANCARVHCFLSQSSLFYNENILSITVLLLTVVL